MSQKCFPRDGLNSPCTPGTPTSPAPMIGSTRTQAVAAARGFRAYPPSASRFRGDSNPCQLATPVPVVSKPGCQPADAACRQLQAAALAMPTSSTKSCTSTSRINQEILGNWLYATNFEAVVNTNTNLQGLVSDDVGW